MKLSRQCGAGVSLRLLVVFLLLVEGVQGSDGNTADC